MADVQHRAKVVESVACAVLTVSDTRVAETDASGRCICDILVNAGHRIHVYEIVPDEPIRIRQWVLDQCESPLCHAVLMTGGTGLAARDTSYEAIEGLLEKKLDGFGELFRSLSYAEIGPAAMLSRAVAGVRNSTIVFSMPGSPDAVRLAMDRLIVPELGHIAWLLAH